MVAVQVGEKWEVHWTPMYGGGDHAYRTFDTQAEAQAWIDGYDRGARENM